jgi:hypothetical protein
VSTLLRDIQDAAVAQIAAQPFFTGGPDDGLPIPVLGENKRDILSEVRAKVARIGACAIVAIGNAPVTHPDIPGPRFEGATLLVYCYERPTINRAASGSGKTALQIAAEAVNALHLITLPIEGISVLVCKAIESAEAAEGEIAYAARFEFAAGGGTAEREEPLVVWSDSVLDAGFVPETQTHTIDCGTP